MKIGRVNCSLVAAFREVFSVDGRRAVVGARRLQRVLDDAPVCVIFVEDVDVVDVVVAANDEKFVVNGVNRRSIKSGVKMSKIEMSKGLFTRPISERDFAVS